MGWKFWYGEHLESPEGDTLSSLTLLLYQVWAQCDAGSNEHIGIITRGESDTMFSLNPPLRSPSSCPLFPLSVSVEDGANHEGVDLNPSLFVSFNLLLAPIEALATTGAQDNYYYYWHTTPMCPNRIIQSKSERSHVPRCANVISFVGRLVSWEVVPVQVRFPNLKPVEEADYTTYNSSMRTNRDGSYKSLQTWHSPRPEMSPWLVPFTW